MIFAAPWVLLALPALPLLWWLLRVTPPAPREERFPAIRLLAGLRAEQETPAHTPPWLPALGLARAPAGGWLGGGGSGRPNSWIGRRPARHRPGSAGDG